MVAEALALKSFLDLPGCTPPCANSATRHGLQVTVWDDDTIEEHNAGRQLFFRPDVGMNKAEVMVYRLNMAYGLNWQAMG